MGIPSYFSYIVKNHANIIKKINYLDKIDNFYLDSNSIIYDTLRLIGEKYENDDTKFEKLLIKETIKKLNEYINLISPKKTLIIAFDGVAPVAKLEQQRTRRYKSYLLSKLTSEINKSSKTTWNKTAITPGTKFMSKLGKQITKYYNTKFNNINNINIIISDSNEVGEGEHKIFNYIRQNSIFHKNTNTLIYGLDADLIMLSLNHLHISNNIYLYRETPEFIKSIDNELEPNENYYMDIPILADAIVYNLTGIKKFDKNVLHDYIFICLLLGNDFLPHFPSLNIRTSGIHTIMATYKNIINTKNIHLCDKSNIKWSNLKILVEALSEQEHNNIKNEYKIRNKLEKKFYPNNTIDEKLYRLQNIPTKRRENEKYIDPFNYYWECRYYEKLFDIDINKAYKQCICINYLEGLEWVFKYYTIGCIDWRWKYKYHYPPLLNDLKNYIPSWGTSMIEKNANEPVSDVVQLSYVLPKCSLNLLSKKNKDKLMKQMKDKYPDNCELEWSFCKYLWEAHPKLPLININNLERLIT